MIQVKNMQMPKGCPYCPMAHWTSGTDEFTGCDVVPGKRYAVTNDKTYAESPAASRPDWCPLEEVPEIPDHLRCRCGGKLSERRYDQTKGKYYRHCGSCNFEFYEEDDAECFQGDMGK